MGASSMTTNDSDDPDICWTPGGTRVPNGETNATNVPSITTCGQDIAASVIDEKQLEPKPPFNSTAAEVGFCFAVAVSQLLSEYLISGFGPLAPYLASSFHSDEGQLMVWPTCALSLAIAATILPLARVADMRGGFPVFMFGALWLSTSTLAGSFCNSEATIGIARAMQGVAAAAMLPASMSMIAALYPAGKRRNIVLGIYSACAPLGFFAGILAATLAVQFSTWRVYFWTAVAASALVALIAYLSTPSRCSRPASSTPLCMDWPGALAISTGLTLIVYSLSTASIPHAWTSAHTLVPLSLGLTSLLLAIPIELHLARCPLLPARFFAPPSLRPFLLAAFLLYGSYGIFLFHGTAYLQHILHRTPLALLLAFLPHAACGTLVALASGALLHRVPPTSLVLVGSLAAVATPLLLVVLTFTPNLSLILLPLAMVAASLALDLTFTVATVVLLERQPPEREALAGAVGSVCFNLAVALATAAGDVVVRARGGGESGNGAPKAAYRDVFLCATGLAALGLVVVGGWVRVPRVEL